MLDGIPGIDETDLARRAARGDVAAFERLVASERAAAVRVATVVLGTPSGADDVVQDATVSAWRGIERLDADRGFSNWYLKAVANAARNEVRSRSRRSAMAGRAAGQRPPAEQLPDDLALAEEDRRAVRQALSRLSEEDRTVLSLRHIEELSERETAEVLDWPVGTVKSRSSRAMGRLRTARGVAVVVAVIVLVVAAVAPLRRAVAHWFGVGSTTIELDRRPEPGAVALAPSDASAGAAASDGTARALPDPLPDPLPGLEDHAAPVPAEAAAALAPVRLGVMHASQLGAPDGYAVPTLLRDADAGVLAWWNDGATTLWAHTGAPDGQQYLHKVLTNVATVGPVDGLGDVALVIQGEHQVQLPGPTVGAGSVVLWMRDSVELRLESDLPIDEMLAIARAIDAAVAAA